MKGAQLSLIPPGSRWCGLERGTKGPWHSLEPDELPPDLNSSEPFVRHSAHTTCGFELYRPESVELREVTCTACLMATSHADAFDD